MVNEQMPHSRLHCDLRDSDKNILFFSLVDYRNNYFTGNKPDKIIEFYKGFENRDQLIQWMKERPKGSYTIHEVEGDKDIIVVITTADFSGEFAINCRNNIFKGLHIIFVESGGREDFYFNYAHNINAGIRKAMEYNPKWVVVSNDDMYKIDDIRKLRNSLNKFNGDEPMIIFSKNRVKVANTCKLSTTTLLRNILYSKVTDYTFHLIKFEKKFNINFLVSALNLPHKLLYRIKLTIPAVADFAIFNLGTIQEYQQLYDETFINGCEDIDLSLSLYSNKVKYGYIDYSIGAIGGGSLEQSGRMMHDICNLSYLNIKIKNNYDFLK